MKQRKKGMQDMHDVTKKGGANELSDENLNDVVGGFEKYHLSWVPAYIEEGNYYKFTENEANILKSKAVNVEHGKFYSMLELVRRGVPEEYFRRYGGLDEFLK